MAPSNHRVSPPPEQPPTVSPQYPYKRWIFILLCGCRIVLATVITGYEQIQLVIFAYGGQIDDKGYTICNFLFGASTVAICMTGFIGGLKQNHALCTTFSVSAFLIVFIDIVRTVIMNRAFNGSALALTIICIISSIWINPDLETIVQNQNFLYKKGNI